MKNKGVFKSNIYLSCKIVRRIFELSTLNKGNYIENM